MGRGTLLEPVTDFQELRSANLVSDFTHEKDLVPNAFEPLGRDMPLVIDQADHSDRRGWIDHSCWALIV